MDDYITYLHTGNDQYCDPGPFFYKMFGVYRTECMAEKWVRLLSGSNKVIAFPHPWSQKHIRDN